MATLVQDIVEAFESEIATELGATYSELIYKYDIEKNSFRTNDKRYGVIPLFAETVEGVLCHYTMDQTFQVVLTHGYVSGVDSSDKESKLFLLYDKMSEITKMAYSKKLGLSSTVLNINPVSIDDPEFLEENKVVILRGNYVVRYRERLDS